MKGRVYKRGERNYAVIVELGRDKDGKRHREWHGGFTTRKAAGARLKDILPDEHTYVSRSDLTVGDYVTRWLEALPVRVRPSTVATYRTLANVYVIPRIGRVPLQSLTNSRLDALYGDLLASGRTNGRGLKAQSVRLVHGMLHRAFKDAVRDRLLIANPASSATRPKLLEVEMKTWSAREVGRFLEGVSEDRLAAAFVVLATTGMRRGEGLGLKWPDIDFEHSRVSVQRSLIRAGSGVAFSETKTERSRRLVALDPHTVAVLRDHKKRQTEERLAIGPGWQGQDLVFANLDGTPINPGAFAKMFHRRVKALGLPPIRVHDLRHTHASLALQAGIHAKVVSERLGHSSVAITLDRYSHAIPSMQDEAAGMVADLVFGAGGSQKVAKRTLGGD